MPNYYGIDVSSYNGKQDWSKAKGISFVIMRITQRYGVDDSFEHNYAGCTKAGLKVGVYRYSYAKTADESRKEAEGVIKTLNGRKLDYPVFLDLEWEKQENFTKIKMGEIIGAFKDVIEKAGYKFGIYTGKSWYENLIPDTYKKNIDYWIAAVPYENKDDGSIQQRLNPGFGVGWQYSWKKPIEGLTGTFDADIFYTDYSEGKKEAEKVGVTVDAVLGLAERWVGRRESDGSHCYIIDVYNSHRPLARGYKVQYNDQWCDTFVSAVFVALNAVDLIGGTECGVEEHVKLFKKAGIWIEDGTITPKRGDIIVFNWDKSVQPNDGYADHIGLVKSVSGKTITTIEGNYKDSVSYRTLQVGNGYIRGYARPKYATTTVEPKKDTSSPKIPTNEEHATVQLGSTGNDVKVLQTYLNKLGCSLVVDGIYGPKTYAAVTWFQNKKALYVDGIVGPVTWPVLIAAANNAKTVTEIAKEVLAGKWGNQPEREKKLKAAGYNYQEVQNEVNRLLKA